MSFKPIQFLKVILKGLPKCDTELMEGNEKTCGAFVNSRLEVYTTDTDLIKAATIKDFNHFVNRNQVFLFFLKSLEASVFFFF